MTKQLKCEPVKTPFDENPEICETLFTFAVPTDWSSKVKKYKYITKQNLHV